MKQFRTYGDAPYSVVLVHGGPGAIGSMGKLAQMLQPHCSVLEALQSAQSIDGQVAELAELLRNHGQAPAILVGHSWGAWLSYITAAKHPELAKKLILIGTPPFEAHFAPGIITSRIERLSQEGRAKFEALIAELDTPGNDNDATMKEFSELMMEADSYKPITLDTGMFACSYDMLRNVWEEADELRASGELLEMGKRITCPIVVLHGNYDPHPFAGVEPLKGVVTNFSSRVFKRCGHTPWLETFAKVPFMAALVGELKNQTDGQTHP